MSTTLPPIYLFLHIPKTAGSTFGRHLVERFAHDEILPLYYGSSYHNVLSGTTEHFQCREDIVAYLSSLTPAQRERLKVVYGHEVYYGLHAFFPEREARYITFLRQPEERTLSSYNYRRRFQWIAPQEPAWHSNPHFRRYWSDVRDNMNKGSEPVSFPYWVEHRWVSNYMHTFLRERGFLDATVTETVDESVFDRFYFVGTTKCFDAESLYLYHALGISRFFPDQNVSRKFAQTLDPRTRAVVEERNRTDLQLYEAAARFACAFKRAHPDFARVVRIMRVRRVCNVRQRLVALDPLRWLYVLSAWFRDRSEVYGKLIDRIKRFVWIG